MRRRGDTGQVTAFITAMTLALILVAGLVLDGGRLLTATREATNMADAAARAGAQEIDEAHLRATGETRLDEDAAEGAAESFVDRFGRSGYIVEATATPDRVTVTVRFDQSLLIIPGAGKTVTGTGTARIAQGA